MAAMRIFFALLAVAAGEQLGNCTWHGLPYDEPVCDIFHHNKTVTQEKLLAGVQLLEAENPGTCVACILAGVWGSLTAANLAAIDVVCNLCSCNNLSQGDCTNDIKAVLYGIIALMPADALAIFKVCKTQCVPGMEDAMFQHLLV